jgi:hypothetical protein
MTIHISSLIRVHTYKWNVARVLAGFLQCTPEFGLPNVPSFTLFLVWIVFVPLLRFRRRQTEMEIG